MCVWYNGAQSEEQAIPGGGPQGGLLTVILFDLQVNYAGTPCPIFPTLPAGTFGPEQDPQTLGHLPPCHNKEKTLRKKYVDDLSLLEAVDLLADLVPLPPMTGPPNFHEIPGLHLPPHRSILQHQLSDLLDFTVRNKMKINFKKTKILPFNLSKKFDFLPQLSFPNHEPLEVIYEARLLGVNLSSDLSWNNHVNNITKSATKKLWILIRFKALGGTQTQLLSVYQMRIRSTLEFAAPVFTSGLTQEQSRRIEMVQMKAFAIILGNQYTSYQSALLTLKHECLDIRRLNLCYKFALKCTQSEKHRSMFPVNQNFRQNMRNPKPFKEFYCRTSRYYNSPIPFLARLLNKYADSTKAT